MVWFRRTCVAVAVTAALAVVAAPASAQSPITYSLAGVETAATPTQGTFVGVAISPDDFGIWRAVILHEPLADTADITGGTFVLDGEVRNLEGLILGGDIVRLGGSCRKERFNVTGDVMLFEDGNPTGEFGNFEVTLTHYGERVPGFGCVTFFATVEGLMTFTPTP